MYSSSLMVVLLCATYTIAWDLDEEYEADTIDVPSNDNLAANRHDVDEERSQILREANRRDYLRKSRNKKNLVKLNSLLERAQPRNDEAKLYNAQVYVKLIQKLLHHYADNTGISSKSVSTDQKRSLGAIAGTIDQIEDGEYKDNVSIGRAIEMLYDRLREIKGNKPVFS
ncbi:uncharacterized protein LOC142980647 [Anticarsia gemmatalis]|uniref:uncharacterized protein LOC142980647 n=1 Tax=Anticarsia gemmatalis TaxID=129554 RepID=UPI003F7659A1